MGYTDAMSTTLPPAEALPLDSLIRPTEQGIASRVLARTAAGNITLFAFDAGEELSEHTAPFDALVLTLSGALRLVIGGKDVRATPQTIVLMPANVPHAVFAAEPARMLLIMLREPKTT
jgi:quercetin dioxygenase-like cupin family protein